jgi:Zn-dependent protease
MTGGVRIGRIFGIAIHIDWSWLLIVLLITWNLSTAFGQLHPEWGIGLRWGVALSAALLFFASVLAHELAHSLTARAQGMPVHSITLFMFGGVSNIQRHPPSPSAEFVMSIVGPLTSIALGVIFALLAGLSAGGSLLGIARGTDAGAAVAQLSPLSTLLLWLGPVNILVGIFNMIPGFPLDGGRVLRSILWAVTDDLRRATRWASWIGQAIAWLMITAGIAMVFGVRIPFFGEGLINGLWLAFIGWFLNSASAESYRQVVVQDVLEGVPVSRIMRSSPPTVPSTSTISNLIYDHVMGTDDHAFPVMDNGRLLGLVTLDDVRQVARDAWDTTTIREIMTPAQELVVATPQEDAADALNKLQERDVRQLPVLRNDELVGLLRRRDLIRWLQFHSDLNRNR